MRAKKTNIDLFSNKTETVTIKLDRYGGWEKRRYIRNTSNPDHDKQFEDQWMDGFEIDVIRIRTYNYKGEDFYLK